MDRGKVLERIIKLLRLGSADANTTEHEMMAAITSAKRLMAQYNIHLADVEAASGHAAADVQFAIHRRVAYTRKMHTLAAYDYNVALAVEALTQTRALITRVHRGGAVYVSMQFVGTETDAYLASELFMVLLTEVRRAARQTMGTGWSSRHTSYALGFSARLIDRARAQVEDLTPREAATYALVVQSKTDRIEQWMEQENTKTEKRRRVTVSHEDYAHGYRDGAHLSLTTRTLKTGTEA